MRKATRWTTWDDENPDHLENFKAQDGPKMMEDEGDHPQGTAAQAGAARAKKRNSHVFFARSADTSRATVRSYSGVVPTAWRTNPAKQDRILWRCAGAT